MKIITKNTLFNDCIIKTVNYNLTNLITTRG